MMFKSLLSISYYQNLSFSISYPQFPFPEEFTIKSAHIPHSSYTRPSGFLQHHSLPFCCDLMPNPSPLGSHQNPEDTLVPFLEIRDLDCKSLFSIQASPTAITKIISHFQPFDFIILIHWVPYIAYLGFLMFHTDSMPSIRLPKPGKYSLFSASFIQSNFLYSAFLLLYFLPNYS